MKTVRVSNESTTKDALKTEIAATGSLDIVTTSGEEYHFALANIRELKMVLDTGVIES